MENQDIPEVQDSIHSRLPDIFFSMTFTYQIF